MNNYKSGKFAEFLSKIILIFHGYTIIKSNYITGKGTHAGEIDIIAKRRNNIIFVEVKKRGNLDVAGYCISDTQKKRISTSANNFIAKHNFKNADYSFSAILFNKYYQFKYIKNAWSLDV